MTHLFALFVLLTSCFAQASILDDYVQQHAAGTLLAGDARLDNWREHTSNRSIEFSRAKEGDVSTTAYFHEKALLDGTPQEAFGVIRIFHPEGKITGMEWALVDEAQFDLAVGGQVADVASTAIGLAGGLHEANPLGLLILPIKVATNSLSKDMNLADCITTRTALGTIGWGAAAANLGTLAGLGPVGLAIGIAVGFASLDSVKKDAPGRCVDIPDFTAP